MKAIKTMKMMDKMKKGVLVTAILAFALVGCSKMPLERLKSEDEAPELTVQYWKAQSKSDPALWEKALDFCKGKLAEAGNCQNVLWANTFLQEEKYSHQKHETLKLPGHVPFPGN